MSTLLRIFNALDRRHLLNWIPDKAYLKMDYRLIFGKKLDLRNPKTFNEKLQWLKLNDRRPEYIRMVDKYEAKKLVGDLLGDRYIIPTLGLWESFDQIDFDLLPNQFVLKCTHDSGGLVICKDKSTFDRQKAKEKIERSLHRNYYYSGREWPYKNVKPRIIAEKFMSDENTTEDLTACKGDIRDYKFFCFNGKVKCFKIDFDRFVQHRANYYDRNGVLLDFGEAVCPPNPHRVLHMPNRLKEMIQSAELLAANYLFMRVDFYEVNGLVLFGELTLYPASGLGKFIPDSWDRKLGDWLSLK